MKNFFNSRNGRIFIENLTAYVFLLPSTVIIFTFGIFPVVFAFFVSLHRWRRFPGEYEGIGNYTKSLGNFAYVLFFWLALLILIYAGVLLFRLYQHIREDKKVISYAIPGLVNAIAISLFTVWFFRVLPIILEVPRRLPRDQIRNRQIFIDEFFNSFRFPEVTEIANLMVPAIFFAIVVSLTWLRLVRVENFFSHLVRFTSVFLAVITGVFLFGITLDEINTVLAEAQSNGEEPPIWSQVILISAGAGLLGIAYWLWQRANREMSDRRFFMLIGVALVFIMGGYLLVTEIPSSLANADDDMLQGFWITVLYVLGTVPVQLGVGLGLAYLLFNLSRGKSFFRMMYFLPYITPFAATAVVFSTLFSNRENSPINRMLGFFGVEAQTWLLEPKPINELILGRDLPQLLEGPGLALVVIIIWSAWTYIGYDTVIFMAGLGSISSEYYEAARIDGASTWSLFRHITLPLLSPTTFFLSLVAIIGTFQAFTQIWIMRRPAAYDATDTVSVYLFDTINSKAQYGYGSAMTLVLFGVILLITLFQNRVLGRKVFYG